jgi:molybdate transport system substrate-binding protein
VSVPLSTRFEGIFVNHGLCRFLILFATLGFVCSAGGASLTIAAAADISSADSALTSSFQKAFPEDSLRFVFSASGALAQQIENGAPYDVFLSANETFVDQLVASKKILPDSVETYALGQLGIFWRDSKPHNLRDLSAEWVRFIAIANPQLAPYGAAARQALESEGPWDTLRTKIVFGENVRQALQQFDSGNAEVVLTAYSLLVNRPGAAIIPSASHRPIRQKAGIVAASQQVGAARRFLEFLRSAEGARILSSHGLVPVK